jgi:hypothetical protein
MNVNVSKMFPFILLFSIFILAGCGDEKTDANTDEQREVENAVSENGEDIGSPESNTQNDLPAFQTFFDGFKKAVIDRDNAAVDSHIQFPLTVQGEPVTNDEFENHRIEIVGGQLGFYLKKLSEFTLDYLIIDNGFTMDNVDGKINYQLIALDNGYRFIITDSSPMEEGGELYDDISIYTFTKEGETYALTEFEHQMP